MDDVPFSNQKISSDLLTNPIRRIEPGEIDTLWRLFEAIEAHWKLNPTTALLRSRWLDMVDAKSKGEPSYIPEYINAAEVFDELETALGSKAPAFLFKKTIVTAKEEATTRLLHAKFYVVNDFIRCLVALGGFRSFVSRPRNYRGFMGGSRFREWPPVRTGERL